MMPNKWEIWIAEVKFEDDLTKSKERPVLVVDKENEIYFSIKITSHAPREKYDGEYSIQKWEKAGLSKPSTLRTSKRLELIDSDFRRKLGKLSTVDIVEVKKIIYG